MMLANFEIDPALAAQAVDDGRKLHVEVFSVGARVCYRCTVGQPSPHRPRTEAAAAALAVPNRA